MKCPKCGYHSFEHLENCKKCGNDLTEHKAKFNLRGFFFPAHAELQVQPEMDKTVSGRVPDEGDINFGFDFLEEDEPTAGEESFVLTEKGAVMVDALDEIEDFDKTPESVSLDDGADQVSLDQPFGIDAETVPADEPDTPRSNKDPGSEFSF